LLLGAGNFADDRTLLTTRKGLADGATNGALTRTADIVKKKTKMKFPSIAKLLKGLERVNGIEPSSSAWKAVALPLSYTREQLPHY
jgi:hypothetical protein